jgi:hypothetical protein
MAKVNTTHEFQYGTYYAWVADPASGVSRDMYRRGQNVRSAAMRLAGDDTGRLRTSLHVEIFQRGGVVGAKVGSNVEHAAYHHEGHDVITPRRPGGVLVFRVRGGPIVFTKHVRAVEGTEYLRKALPAVRD